MARILRLKNRLIAKILGRFPSLCGPIIASYRPRESKEIPWTPVRKALRECKVAIVTTTGVHHKDDKPFDMGDPRGDATYRMIDAARPVSDLMITHDYYDHSDADRDINVVFPIERLREFEEKGIIGALAERHYSFMGHIVGGLIDTLVNKTAPEVVEKVKAGGVDVVLLTPG